MHLLSITSNRASAALATLGLVLAGCASDGSGGPTTDPGSAVPQTSAAPGAPSADPGESTASAPAPAAPTEASTGGDVGPAAAPGEGRLVVNGTTYALTIDECTFNADGPAKGTVEVRATENSGGAFSMTQFYLNDKWSQTSVQLDFGATNIYVIKTGSSAGATPATVDGANVTWIEEYRELDVAANSQVNVGAGVLNLTCN